ncbi:Actin-related protein 2/3 complex subunit 5 [Entamoeba marina]
MAEDNVDFSALVAQHTDISDSIIKGQTTLEEGLPQLLDVIPLGDKNVELLEKNAEAILSVINTVKDVKDTLINSLTSEQQDSLLMYVYKGLGASENKDATFVPSPQVMFKWFNAIHKNAGDGCVMRAVSRRKAL